MGCLLAPETWRDQTVLASGPAARHAAWPRGFLAGHSRAGRGLLLACWFAPCLSPLCPLAQGRVMRRLPAFVLTCFLSPSLPGSAGISGDKVEVDPVTNHKASTKFWIKQKPISIDSELLCTCDLAEEKSPSK